MTPATGHVPVLLREVLAVLAPAPGEVFVDCTAGLGGHAAAVAPHLAPGGTVILNDLDPANLARAQAAVADALAHVPSPPRVVALRGNFADLPHRLADLRLQADMLLADLGFASCHVDDPARGFSFQHDGPLDMRLDPDAPLTAAHLVASLTEAELAQLIRDFGDEPAARRIARKLVAARESTPISTTGRLAEAVRSAVGGRRGGIDPATRTFQALRIAVNDELGSLAALLHALRRSAPPSGAPARDRQWLRPGARVAFICFHSLEDRAVKHTFRELEQAAGAAALTPGPLTPSTDEIARNPRARSARLRAVRLAADTAAPPRSGMDRV